MPGDCRTCQSAHCSGVDAEINAVCKAMGWPVSHPVVTRDSIGVCCCSCSCLAHGTPVQAGDKSYRNIEAYQEGDSVLAAGKSLNWSAHTVVFSAGTVGASRQKYTVLITYGGENFIAVTSDHLFLLAGGLLRRADRLRPTDMLVAPDGSQVAIQSIHIGDYLSGFHHIATSKTPPDPSLNGHLLNTNGVVSADYTVQLFHRSNELAQEIVDASDPDLIVGSPEYVAKFGDSCLKAPSESLGIAISRNNTDVVEQTFISAETTRLSIPDDARPFISEEEAEAKAADPRRPWNDPLAREWTDYLIQHHSAFYPNVTYHFDWADSTVNAYAWVQNGVRHVAILGGLVRHLALELEGIAVVLAHELAHHFGGQPTFPGGLSCEGQSDYYGVAVVMRRVWFGTEYGRVTDDGIAQMAAFFGVPNNPNAPGGSAGCNHPAGACRVATYHRAVRLTGKPGCAV